MVGASHLPLPFPAAMPYSGVPLSQGHLVLHYQPRVNLRNGAVDCVEALVRWNHPENGLVLPEHFVPRAEETGDIREIGCWVLDEAIRQAKCWLRAGQPARVSVNVSALQFETSEFVDAIGRALATHALPSGLLEVELTESLVVKDEAFANKQFIQLINSGVGLAIDDFGAGYAGVRTLDWMPASVIKIDRSLITAMGHERSKLAVVSGINALARAVGATCVAEGIETHEQLLALQKIGCHEGQGFLFCSAVIPEELPWQFVSVCANSRRVTTCREIVS